MFDFKKDYILENDKVKLIPLKFSHYDELVHFATEEPELWTYSLMQANSPEKMKAYIEHALKAREKDREYPFVVFDKTTNRFAGSTRFYDIQLNNQSLQLGFTWYGKAFQGTNLNKNCKFLLLEFAFEIMKMQRVEFRADSENKRSIAAMKSIGCVEEGILRSNSPKADGGRRDSIVLSILKDEWRVSIKENLYLKL